MNWVSLIFSVSLAGFFLGACATDRSLNRSHEKATDKVPEKVPERVIVQIEPSENYDVLAQSLNALAERLKTLEESVATLKAKEAASSSLESKIASLEEYLRNFQARPPLNHFKLPKEVSLCGERIPLEDRNVWENLDREFLVAVGSEAQVLLWMKRARRYFPNIEGKLREMGLPDDLKYVAIVESGLRPYAVSSSGASGIWQFIPSTGERYGMKKNRVIDERFDFFKATEGALTYLKNLYEEFKSWSLSMAAYNAGENRVRKEVELQGTRNYFYLDLPMETERYVYKIAAAKIILSDPGRYGYGLEEKECYEPLQVDRVQIEISQPLSLLDVARAVGSYPKEIREMNPHLSENAIPPGMHFLNLPPGTSWKFWPFFSNWQKEPGRK